MSSQGGLREAVLPGFSRPVRLRHSDHLPPLQGPSFDRKAVESRQHARRSGHGRSCLHGSQLRVRVVSKADSLSATLLRYYVSTQEARRPRTIGAGSTKTPFQGALLGGSKSARCKRTVRCSQLRCVGTLLESRK